ncbi:putative F-box protein At3g17500 [Brassica napus]|uniref:putative F-box protein At3g17500 n=1 Tax=Brassica napus TaxID=3708 RepID=UPI0006AA9217|nr:putative F-box protein At3g17500 [Brassica napus]
MTRDALRLLYLPWDLVIEILSRVLTTSVRRLRFTCKRWNALFKDQEFIKKHMDKAPKQCKVLTLSDSKVYSMNVNLNGIHDNVVDPQTLLSLNDFHNPEQFKIYKIFHCNGLLLCTTTDLKLVVWNPFTGQIRWIPYSDHYKDDSKFVLGYENNKSRQTYKILRYSLEDYQVVDHGVYDFESHSWKNLNDVVPKNCSVTSKGVSLKGNIYWIAHKNYEEDLLLTFDFSTEKFRCLSIPFPSVDDDCVATALSVVREEQLSVLYSSVFNTRPKIEIWMTIHDKIDQTKVVSWSKFLSLELDENNPQITVSSFFMDEEKKAAVLCDLDYRNKRNKDMVYIVGEDNLLMKIPVGESRLQFLRPVIHNYVPSLVRIQQGGVMTRERKRKNRH